MTDRALSGLAMLLWRALALVCLVLGIVGVFLPVLPTVPFLLVAAWAGGRGWPRLERWLLQHPTYGPPIRRWREKGAVPRRAKWLASVMMLGSAVTIVLLPLHIALKIGVPAVMLAVALWLWARPEG
jgi:uncharacterized membrane protein YbaN (DUF454 family)